MKKIITVVALALVLLPAFVYAVDPAGTVVDPGTKLDVCKTLGSNGIAGVVSCIVGFMNNAVYLLMAAGVLYIMWGAFQLMKQDEKKREEAKKTVMYGIIGLFVMISIWGLVNILYSTFNLSAGAKAPPALIPGK